MHRASMWERIKLAHINSLIVLSVKLGRMENLHPSLNARCSDLSRPQLLRLRITFFNLSNFYFPCLRSPHCFQLIKNQAIANPRTYFGLRFHKKTCPIVSRCHLSSTPQLPTLPPPPLLLAAWQTQKLLGLPSEQVTLL